MAELGGVANFDFNVANNATKAIPVGRAESATFQVQADTAAIGNTVVTIERSNNAEEWYALESATTITGVGMTGRLDVRGIGFLRARVSTVAGGAVEGKIVWALSAP